ncbi:MAG: M48 family metallopeptidase [Clostridia bacterium]|nr:M48 family metallopeptidase [Clostridia bacterium]
MNYTVKHSNRKSISLELTPDGLLVRAPRHATDAEIEAIVRKHRRWIETHQQKQARELAIAEAEGALTMKEIRALADQAKDYIPERVAHYAPLIGVRPGRITIRNQKTRWGSCSSKGNLNFNCLLMLTPPEVIDSIVVHELCHLKEMNHSKRFYAEILRVFPEYHKWHRWLKDHGGAIMKRAFS